MKRILALSLTFAMSLVGSPLFAAAPKGSAKQPPSGQQQNGSICGTASSQTGEVLPNLTAQIRDLATGQVVGTQTTNDKGEYCFANLPPGNYAVEALNPAGQVIGTSASISLSAGQSITGIVLQAAAGLLTAGGAAGRRYRHGPRHGSVDRGRRGHSPYRCQDDWRRWHKRQPVAVIETRH